jgi:hypothetical protein
MEIIGYSSHNSQVIDEVLQLKREFTLLVVLLRGLFVHLFARHHLEEMVQTVIRHFRSAMIDKDVQLLLAQVLLQKLFDLADTPQRVLRVLRLLNQRIAKCRVLADGYLESLRQG